jgi:hypothetical protein
MSVLIDEDNVLKIKKAKEIIIAYGQPPAYKLADRLNLKKLKWFQTNFMILFMGFYLIIKWISPENYLTADLIM